MALEQLSTSFYLFRRRGDTAPAIENLLHALGPGRGAQAALEGALHREQVWVRTEVEDEALLVQVDPDADAVGQSRDHWPILRSDRERGGGKWCVNSAVGGGGAEI